MSHMKFFSMTLIYVKNKRKPLRFFFYCFYWGGGHLKTMGIVMHLIKQCDNFNQIYVTVTDKHFRKSLMHALLKQYNFLGIKHLAKLCGHTTNNQWEYIKNICSIHKSFEFLERLRDSLRITLPFEFYNFLIATLFHNYK